MERAHNRKKRRLVALLAGLAVVVTGAVVVLNARPSLAGWPIMSVRASAEPDALTLRYLGTAGVVLSDGKDALVIDGFVSRPPLRQVLLGRVVPDRARVQQVLARTLGGRLDAVMVAHSHYDHAMDAATWAKLAGGEVWGTLSTQRIARAEGVANARIVSSADTIAAGDFTVRFFELDHAPGEKMKGVIEEGFSLPARAVDYRTGGGLGFYFTHDRCRILAVPSAGRTRADLTDYPADVILLSIGQLGLQDDAYIRGYWRDTVVASGAKLVIPVHWDDFTRSLDQPLRPLPYVVERIDKAMAKITALAGPDVTVALPVLFEPLDLSASGRC